MYWSRVPLFLGVCGMVLAILLGTKVPLIGRDLNGTDLNGSSLEGRQVLSVNLEGVVSTYSDGSMDLPLCGEDSEGQAIPAIPVQGRWNLEEGVAGGGAHLDDMRGQKSEVLENLGMKFSNA